MTPRSFATLASTFIALAGHAQYEAAHWYFGQRAGLDFTCDPPQVRRSGMYYTIEGCASISDADGHLLFYTQGDSVYDRSHHMMPNGFGIGIDPIEFGSSTQGALIVPKPGSSSIHYIFTVDCAEDSLLLGFRYSEVDMSLNGGLGEVTSKFNLITGPVTEKLAAVHHANGEDVWVLAHEHGTDAFLAYLVTSAGISTTPVVSHCGATQILPTDPYCMARGHMKFSPNGRRLVVLSTSDCHSYVFPPQLFDFDDATGEVSFRYTMEDPAPEPPMYYGASFSPSSQLLYMTQGWYANAGSLLQFDAAAADPAAFEQSREVIYVGAVDNERLGALQIGPDGSIYIVTQDTWIARIAQPNEPGPACGFTFHHLQVPYCTVTHWGLPNYIESYFKNSMLGHACPPDSIHAAASFLDPLERICVGDTVQFFDASSSYPEDVAVWSWHFDDPGSFPDHVSSLQQPAHAFSAPGIHQVRLIAGIDLLPFECKSDTISLTVRVEPCGIGMEELSSTARVVQNEADLVALFQGLCKVQCAELTIVDRIGRVCAFFSQGNAHEMAHWHQQATPGPYYFMLNTGDRRLAGRFLLTR